MKTTYLLLLSLTTILIGCEDRVSKESTNTQREVTPVQANKCDTDVVFDGITTVAEITDSTAKISWQASNEQLGYTLFKDTGSEILEIVQNISSSETSLVVQGLTAETSYTLLLRAVAPNGHYDCNDNYKNIQTTVKSTFISCKEINDFYVGAKPSGVYEIDTDLSGPKAPIEVYCDMDNNDGGWTQVFNHVSTSGMFADKAEALETNIADPQNDKYSILSKLEEFKRDGKLEFWLHYPDQDGIDGGNIWTQISNPATESINGYVSIRSDYTDMYWGGLEKSDRVNTLIDGSVSHAWWFYAIGSNTQWGGTGTIPGPLRNTGISKVKLFVK
jgi:hypothetical protein